MDILQHKQQHILIAGNDKLAVSLCVCMLQAGHQVTVYHILHTDFLTAVRVHLDDILEYNGELISLDKLSVVSRLDAEADFDLAVAVTGENIEEKTELIKNLERYLPKHIPIAVNIESIKLSVLQEYALHPERLLGANWVEPVHTTCFLEIVTNDVTDKTLLVDFDNLARQSWNKDPYVLKNDVGIRAKMMSALLREAFYLVENDYVTIEDIDRACRNDAGYYMPFAGNFRYMDLMGTYMYGVVMQDLNPELSKDTHIPAFCRLRIDNGDKGMASGDGFYHYEPSEAEEWEATFRKFSYQIQKIINKYPFNYLEKYTPVKS